MDREFLKNSIVRRRLWSREKGVLGGPVGRRSSLRAEAVAAASRDWLCVSRLIPLSFVLTSERAEKLGAGEHDAWRSLQGPWPQGNRVPSRPRAHRAVRLGRGVRQPRTPPRPPRPRGDGQVTRQGFACGLNAFRRQALLAQPLHLLVRWRGARTEAISVLARPRSDRHGDRFGAAANGPCARHLGRPDGSPGWGGGSRRDHFATVAIVPAASPSRAHTPMVRSTDHFSRNSSTAAMIAMPSDAAFRLVTSGS